MRSVFTFCGKTLNSSGTPVSPQAAKSKDSDRQESQSQKGKPSPQSQTHWVDDFSADKVMDRLSSVEQVTSEVIPYMAPKISAACPILLGACTSYDIYSSCRDEYRHSKNLPPETRSRYLASKAGDATLTNTLSGVALPTLLARQVHRMVANALTNPRIPSIVARQPNMATATVLVVTAVATAKPVNNLVNAVMDRTYRPLFCDKTKE